MQKQNAEWRERQRQKVFGWPAKDPYYEPPRSFVIYRERFEHYLDLPDPVYNADLVAEKHWTWTGPVKPDGRARMHVYGVEVPIRNFSWRLHVSDIPAGLFVKNLCDNPLCVAPNHLFLDRRRGAKRKLDAKARHDIFLLYEGSGCGDGMPVPKLASLFEVSETTIYRVISDERDNRQHDANCHRSGGRSGRSSTTGGVCHVDRRGTDFARPAGTSHNCAAEIGRAHV